jgi:hypothetical protein
MADTLDVSVSTLSRTLGPDNLPCAAQGTMITGAESTGNTTFEADPLRFLPETIC